MTPTTYPTLTALDGFPIPVYVSHGQEARGRALAGRTVQALDWLGQVTGLQRRPTLVVADEHDWPVVCEVPVYGMPFSIPGKIGTSTTPAPWWQEFLDALLPHLDPPVAADVADTFGRPPQLSGIADLIVTHEATHLFHEIHPVTFASEFPDDWVMELFANLGMYGYLATHEPDRLGLLSTMAEATVAAGAAPWPMQDLALMGMSMQASVTNYVWYQFLLIRLAERLWRTGAEQGLLDYQRLLGHPDLSPDDVMARLAELDGHVADSVRRWPHV